ncbi:hypothetical protein ACFXTI_022607 [Malus domestica]
MVYLHNPWSPEKLILCELVDGGCRWWSARSTVPEKSKWVMSERLSKATVIIEKTKAKAKGRHMGTLQK